MCIKYMWYFLPGVIAQAVASCAFGSFTNLHMMNVKLHTTTRSDSVIKWKLSAFEDCPDLENDSLSLHRIFCRMFTGGKCNLGVFIRSDVIVH